MLRSMTGFGASSREEDGFVFHVEIRSVNHRHLMVKTRLSSDFAYLEGEAEAHVKKKLARGSVTVNLSVDRRAAGDLASIQPEVAARYQGEIEALARDLGLDGNVSMDTLLSLPGVVAGSDDGKESAKRFTKAILACIDEALGLLVEMREVEGGAIAKDLAKHASATGRLVQRIEKRMPTVVRSHQRMLERRVGELLEDRQVVSSADVAREVALLADRLDVSEEIARLISHLEQLDTLLAKGGSIGRKLDFLVQEIFREINTIGSKCSDAKVAHWVVEAKTHAERLREQAQNVE